MVLLPSGDIAVSNIQTADASYWADDGQAYIALADSRGSLKERFWVKSTPAFPFSGPKGMCVCQGKLYFTDNQTVKRCDADTGKQLEVVKGLFGERFNDLATDGEVVWVSDVGAGKIYCIKPDGTHREVPSPPNPNGVTCWRGRLFAVSWTQHDVFELDPKGNKPPQAFGVAEHFVNPDGIEVLDDGTFIVSDWNGNKVQAVTPDRKAVYTLIEIDTPADIGIDRENSLLFVPMFKANQGVVYKLTRRN
jgi:outer membrane protein assembly factor BamB